MSRVQRARVITKSCPLYDLNCLKSVSEIFASMRVQPFTPEDAIQLMAEYCGVYKRGAHIGHIKGWAYMTVCVEGGWYRRDYGKGGVLRPGTVLSLEIRDYNGKVLISA